MAGTLFPPRRGSTVFVGDRFQDTGAGFFLRKTFLQLPNFDRILQIKGAVQAQLDAVHFSVGGIIRKS
jgi:hypothetical protein